MLTLSFIVLSSAIFILFLDEFIRLFKKIHSIPGVKLLVPLALASLLVVLYEEGHLRFLLWCQEAFHGLIHFLSKFSPFEKGAVSLTQIVLLVVLAVLPIGCFSLKVKLQKHHQPPHAFTYHLGLALWIIGVVLLSVPSH